MFWKSKGTASGILKERAYRIQWCGCKRKVWKEFGALSRIQETWPLGNW